MTEHHDLIIRYMEKKQEVLKRYFGLDNYFTADDEAAIKEWDNEVASEVFLRMDCYGTCDDFGHIFGSIQCPFCFRHEDNCSECSYAKIHGECNDKDSDYKKSIFKLIHTDTKKEGEKRLLRKAGEEVGGFAYFK